MIKYLLRLLCKITSHKYNPNSYVTHFDNRENKYSNGYRCKRCDYLKWVQYTPEYYKNG